MNTWNYHPSRNIGVPIATRLRGFPREPGMLAYALRSLAALLLRAVRRQKRTAVTDITPEQRARLDAALGNTPPQQDKQQ